VSYGRMIVTECHCQWWYSCFIFGGYRIWISARRYFLTSFMALLSPKAKTASCFTDPNSSSTQWSYHWRYITTLFKKQTTVLYGCETWSLALREEHRLRVSENKVLRGIFRPKRGDKGMEVTEDCIMGSFITCTLCQILLGWSNKGLEGRSM